MTGCPASSCLLEGSLPSPLQIGFLVFPQVTQLDFTGPLQVFTRVPGAKVHLIWRRLEPVQSDTVLTVMPTATFVDCPQLDVICVPGGYGTDELMIDDEVLEFLRKAGQRRSIHHLGLHGIDCARRGWPPEGLSGEYALERYRRVVPAGGDALSGTGLH